ncbi:hotdog domain-containing protein [Isosphaeraceae bacterium EP7]
MSAEERFIVDETNRITFSDSQMPAVLATPWLILRLEFAARHAIEPCLEPHERSVGTYVEVEHLAPAPEGSEVVCRAKVIHVNGPVVTFQVEAHDGIEPLARGIHRRRVIDTERFARRLARKKAQLDEGRG